MTVELSCPICLEKPVPEAYLEDPPMPELGSLFASLSWTQWQDDRRRLHVRFLGGTPELHNLVKEHARTWTEYAAIEFAFENELVTAPDYYEIRIAFANDGHWSHIGTQSLRVPQHQPSMNLQISAATPAHEMRRVILHEFGHALSLVHEHQNPRGGIPWNREAVYAYYWRTYRWEPDKVDINVFTPYEVDHVHASEFDPQSIMLYAIPPELTLNGYSVDWNNELSALDRQYIAEIYPPV